MNTVKENAYAKLNLTLDLVGRENGYHLLDSLVVTVNLCDRVVVKKRRDKLVKVDMRGMGSEFIPPESNIAQRAGEAFVAAFDSTGADITVYKNIPVGAGLGGSSTDGAAVLNAMKKLYGARDEEKIEELADAIGSDVRFLLSGGLARMQGRGERVTSLAMIPMNFFLICPQSGVSTKECYAKCDEYGWQGDGTRNALGYLNKGDLSSAARYFQNDLYKAAAWLNPDAEKALKEAESFSPLAAGMTGSGSAAFALFETRELCLWAQSRYRGKFRTYCVSAVIPEREKKNVVRNPYFLSEEEY